MKIKVLDEDTQEMLASVLS